MARTLLVILFFSSVTLHAQLTDEKIMEDPNGLEVLRLPPSGVLMVNNFFLYGTPKKTN